MSKTAFLALQIEESDNQASMYIYGGIPDIDWNDFIIINTARDFVKEFRALEAKHSTIDIHINSPGGWVDEGLVIFNTIRQSKKHVNTYNDGLAASMGGVILMAGHTVHAPKNSLLMIHNAWGKVVGNAQELREAAEVSDKYDQVLIEAFADKLGKSADKVRENYFNYKDHWFTGQEAYDEGFVDVLIASDAEIPEDVNKDMTLDLVQNRFAASFRSVSTKNDNMKILELFGFSKDTASKLSAEDKKRLESAEEKLASIETERDSAVSALAEAQKQNGTLEAKVKELEGINANNEKSLEEKDAKITELNNQLDKKPAGAATTVVSDGDDDSQQSETNKYETSADKELAEIKSKLKIS